MTACRVQQSHASTSDTVSLRFSALARDACGTARTQATYQTPTGEPRTARCEVMLPLAMVSEPMPPQKNSNFKITLETNRMPPPIGRLFEDVLSKQPQILQVRARRVACMQAELHPP